MNSRKKVALIVPGGFGTGKNNLGIPVLEQIVALLANQQLEVTVFQLFKVNDGYVAKGFQLLDFKANNKIAQYLSFLMAFYRNHKKNNFEAVHGFWTWPCGFLAVLLGKVFNIKSIVSVLGGDAASLPEFNYGHLRKFFSRNMILWSLKNCDEGTALTHYLAKNLYHAGLKTKLKIIPWGVDQQVFSFQPKSLQDPVQFLHVANLNLVKDQRTLLLAFEIIHRALPSHLTIIGEGTEEKNIRSLIDRLQLQDAITLSGHWPYETLPDFYHKADVLLHTSRSEGQSEVVTEAISCGTLVAGTKVGLIHDFPELTVSVNIGDFESLAKNVISLLRDQKRMNHLRDSAHVWAMEHSVHWTVSQIIKLY
jgi:glycosyltransferase involved in cell wall biosynthesis